jgi:hypothetical protein
MTKGELMILIGLLVVATGTYITIKGREIRSAEISAEREIRETKTGELEAPEVNITKDFFIQLGGVIIQYGIDDLRRGINLRQVINIGYDYPISINIDDSKLYVSVDILNEKNESIATIERNQWTINNNPIIARDRNYNEFAFEVIDAQLIPRVQVILMPNNWIYIGGYYHMGNNTILLVPDGFIGNPSEEQLSTSSQEKIFQYPSDENHGRMNPDIDLSEIHKLATG